MKKILRIALPAIVAAVAGYGVYQAQTEGTALSEITLANVEALAYEGETVDGRELYEHHCGDSPGTQCKALGVTGNSCPYERSCP